MPAFNSWNFWTALSVFSLTVRNGRLWPSHWIWTVLLRWAAEFRELGRGIWQNFPRKTVGPTDVYFWRYVLLVVLARNEWMNAFVSRDDTCHNLLLDWLTVRWCGFQMIFKCGSLRRRKMAFHGKHSVTLRHMMFIARWFTQILFHTFTFRLVS